MPETVAASVTPVKHPAEKNPAIMSETKLFSFPCLDLECFLNAKTKLRQEGILDSVLKTNLEYSIQVLENMPVIKRTNVSLLVEGEKQLVRFTSGSPVIHYTVRFGTTGPELHQKVHVGAKLTPSSVADFHFDGHHCQDELEPCWEQARQALQGGGLANVELRILCNELKITYITQQPQRTITIKPRCRVNLGRVLSLHKLLEVKNWMEERGTMGKGMLLCFQHLLVCQGQYQAENAKLVLQSEGRIMELISGWPDCHNIQYYIFTDSNNQVQSHKVQDIDLWDSD